MRCAQITPHITQYQGMASSRAVAARNERQRRAYTPDEVRERLHARHARANAQRP